jgi:hypothetical protein
MMDGQKDGIKVEGADDRSCRLTGAATFTGVGIYAIRQAQLQGTFQRVRPKGGSVVGGQVTAVIGIGELFFQSVYLDFRAGMRMGTGLMVVCISLGLGRLVM